MITKRRSVVLLSVLSLMALPPLLASACSATRGSNGFGEGGGGEGGDNTSGTFAQGVGGGLSLDGGGSGGFEGDPKTCAEAAASKSYIGCDFWPTVVSNQVWEIFDFAAVVANAGSEEADVTVTRNGATIASAKIPPNKLGKIYLPWVKELKGEQYDECTQSTPITQTVRAPGGAYHLTSTRPVTVYQFNALEYAGEGGPPGKSWSSCPGNQFCDLYGITIGCFSFSNDASLLLPSTAMTGNYRITAQASPGGELGAYFAITGITDNTTVTVKVSSTGQIVGGGGVAATGANGLVTFPIKAGEVVQVMSDPFSDIGGTQVQASNPVQVITGISCTQAPVGTPACDHIEESVFPIETLGKHYFVTVPTAPNGDVIGHIVRIYGNVDGTALTYVGTKPPGAPASISAGEVVDLGVVSGDFEITGDHEFAVGSFMLGAALLDPTATPPEQRGDPSQSLATAVEQYRTKYIFLTPDTYDFSYVDVIQPMDASLTIDGQKVTVSPKAISSGFGIARVKLGAGDEGAHVLTSSAAVGIQVMGYGAYTSYQYPGGLNLQLIAPPPPPPK